MAIADWPGVEGLPEVARWRVVGQRQIYSDHRVTVERAEVEPPGAPSYAHHVVRLPNDSVAVVVHHPGRGVLLLYRYRFITGTAGLAVPAGGVEAGEEPLAAAGREVAEETGCELVSARVMASTEVMPGVTDKRFHLVYGRTSGQKAKPMDSYESTALYWVPAEELTGLMAVGLISAQPSMLALLYADKIGLLGG